MGGTFYALKFSFLVALWPQLSDEVRKVRILYSVQHFLIEMGVTFSCSFLYPKQETGCPVLLRKHHLSLRKRSDLGEKLHGYGKRGRSSKPQAPGRCLQGNASCKTHCLSGFLLSYFAGLRGFTLFSCKLKHTFKKTSFSLKKLSYPAFFF